MTLNDRVVETYLTSLDCPRALTVYLLWKHGEHQQLVHLGIDPAAYNSPSSFRLAFLATKFLSKADFLKTEINLEETAIDGFLRAESACKEINHDDFLSAHLKHAQFEWVHNASIRKIGAILGDFDGEEWVESSNWGPGVTLDVKRDTSATNKFRLETGTTCELHDFTSGFFASAYPLWSEYIGAQPTDLHPGNKVVTVPKNSKTDRVIAVEPGINLWFQKGVGTMIRRRLLRQGVDLNDQSRNQRLAKLSSKTGHLATVDFSAASDTISRATVRHLLAGAPRWLLVMDILRSRCGFIRGAWHAYEKFSSMGNGYTFELESLIFFAIATSCCEALGLDAREVSVYGDDVIIPVEAFDTYVKVCAIYGFTVNTQKSYSSGWFRESCGEYYYQGVDCKPWYLKEAIEDEESIYKAANSIRRLARRSYHYGCDARFHGVWRLLRRQLGSDPCLVSEGVGDVGFVVNFDEASPSLASRRTHSATVWNPSKVVPWSAKPGGFDQKRVPSTGWEGFAVTALVAVPNRYYSSEPALLLARLWDRSIDRQFGNEVDRRSRVTASRRKTIVIAQWQDLGPWV